MCTEAGLLALRERRMRVTHADFKKAKEKVASPPPMLACACSSRHCETSSCGLSLLRRFFQENG